MAVVNANGLGLWVERLGEGAPLLVINGTGSDLRRRPNILDSPLMRAFDLLTYDQRGLGQSDKPDGPYTMADYADDAAALLDAVGWAGANVLAISFGGMVGQELAIRHPARVKKLVLCCTSPGGAGGASYPLHTIQDLSAENRARHMIPISDRRHDAAWASAHPDEYEAYVAMASADPYGDEPRAQLGRRLQLEARATHDAWDRLDRIVCPTLIAGGRYDGIATPEAQERMAARIPHAKLQMFEGGHLFMIQDRAAFPAMIAFLR